ncbi:glucohydrolase [Corynebacterium sp. 13CS0277]|uniref:glycoside hydrolase family 13 protein n=1 Tax=Corynebacterium sp. 13CS0277 TaxID=2071994 RepID=UPI000D02F6F8|nr:alpha-glucosidase [Corynebacterium sp. 13CS0277]PRQ12216.1 glucohydrolase [Corynebacterium sp. 13CS0277]
MSTNPTPDIPDITATAPIDTETASAAAAAVPDDFRAKVIYQIYPRSFCDSNGDGIGDLPGITSRLDYLQQLGVDVLWLSPIFASPNDDNGYDISNYREIMAEFGTMADFDTFLEQAHARGMGIMLDLVVNHTSDEHEWFEMSRRRVPGYEDYYIWRDEPNNWVSCFSPSAWEFDEVRGQYYLHMFSPKQPDLNWDNPAVRQEVYDLMRFWLDKGVDGFRMDVINVISKDPEFPDDPRVAAGGKESSLHMAARGPRVHEYLQEMRREVLDHYPTITVGETPDTTPEDGILFAGVDRGELDMIFTFEHMFLDGSEQGFGKWSTRKASPRALMGTLARWQEALQGRAWNSLYWNNHDQPRVVSRFGNDAPAWRELSAMMLGTTLHMLCGTPFIYQGEELGMTNVAFARLEDYNDLEIHNAYRTYVTDSQKISHEEMMAFIAARGRDNARTPMQWDSSPHAGFTTGTPWLPVAANYPEINAASALARPGSVFHHYRELIRLRHTLPIITFGTFELLHVDEDVVAYRRQWGGRSLVVVANFRDTFQARHLPQLAGEEFELLNDNYSTLQPAGWRPVFGELFPYEAQVWVSN